MTGEGVLVFGHERQFLLEGLSGMDVDAAVVLMGLCVESH
jgi:hypothetical protein